MIGKIFSVCTVILPLVITLWFLVSNKYTRACQKVCHAGFSVKLTDMADTDESLALNVLYLSVNRDNQMSIFSLRPVQTGGLGSVFFLFVSVQALRSKNTSLSIPNNQQGRKSGKETLSGYSPYSLSIWNIQQGRKSEKEKLSGYSPYSLSIRNTSTGSTCLPAINCDSSPTVRSVQVINKEGKAKSTSDFSLAIGYWLLVIECKDFPYGFAHFFFIHQAAHLRLSIRQGLRLNPAIPDRHGPSVVRIWRNADIKEEMRWNLVHRQQALDTNQIGSWSLFRLDRTERSIGHISRHPIHGSGRKNPLQVWSIHAQSAVTGRVTGPKNWDCRIETGCFPSGGPCSGTRSAIQFEVVLKTGLTAFGSPFEIFFSVQQLK